MGKNQRSIGILRVVANIKMRSRGISKWNDDKWYVAKNSRTVRNTTPNTSRRPSRKKSKSCTKSSHPPLVAYHAEERKKRHIYSLIEEMTTVGLSKSYREPSARMFVICIFFALKILVQFHYLSRKNRSWKKIITEFSSYFFLNNFVRFLLFFFFLLFVSFYFKGRNAFVLFLKFTNSNENPLKMFISNFLSFHFAS